MEEGRMIVSAPQSGVKWDLEDCLHVEAGEPVLMGPEGETVRLTTEGTFESGDGCAGRCAGKVDGETIIDICYEESSDSEANRGNNREYMDAPILPDEENG